MYTSRISLLLGTIAFFGLIVAVVLVDAIGRHVGAGLSQAIQTVLR